MSALGFEISEYPSSKNEHAVLEVTVNNHPGVMSQICGLFARRTYNVEAILCLPLDGGQQSRIWLLVKEDERLCQVIKQVNKLEDVLDVQQTGVDHDVFLSLEEFFRSGKPHGATEVSWST